MLHPDTCMCLSLVRGLQSDACGCHWSMTFSFVFVNCLFNCQIDKFFLSGSSKSSFNLLCIFGSFTHCCQYNEIDRQMTQNIIIAFVQINILRFLFFCFPFYRCCPLTKYPISQSALASHISHLRILLEILPHTLIFSSIMKLMTISY